MRLPRRFRSWDNFRFWLDWRIKEKRAARTLVVGYCTNCNGQINISGFFPNRYRRPLVVQPDYSYPESGPVHTICPTQEEQIKIDFQIEEISKRRNFGFFRRLILNTFAPVGQDNTAINKKWLRFFILNKLPLNTYGFGTAMVRLLDILY